MLNFDIYRLDSVKPATPSSTKYWMALELPGEFANLNMQQLTALRRMVMKAYDAGRKTK